MQASRQNTEDHICKALLTCAYNTYRTNASHLPRRPCGQLTRMIRKHQARLCKKLLVYCPPLSKQCVPWCLERRQLERRPPASSSQVHAAPPREISNAEITCAAVLGKVSAGVLTACIKQQRARRKSHSNLPTCLIPLCTSEASEKADRLHEARDQRCAQLAISHS